MSSFDKSVSVVDYDLVRLALYALGLPALCTAILALDRTCAGTDNGTSYLSGALQF